MKQIFEIKDKKIIYTLLDEVEFGTLALSQAEKPYSLPINFVRIDDVIYFHGAKSGKKVSILKQNKKASFSVVKPYSLIPSYFSSNDGLACPATHFFKSVIVDGEIEFVENNHEKILALSALMKKLQSEGGYISLSEDIYQKAIDATMVFKLKILDLRAKYKFGQHLKQERFDMIIEHLKKRDSSLDRATIRTMHSLKDRL